MLGISLALTGLILFIFSMAAVAVSPMEFGGDRDKHWLIYTLQSIIMVGVIAGVVLLFSGLIIAAWSI